MASSYKVLVSLSSFHYFGILIIKYDYTNPTIELFIPLGEKIMNPNKVPEFPRKDGQEILKGMREKRQERVHCRTEPAMYLLMILLKGFHKVDQSFDPLNRHGIIH